MAHVFKDEAEKLIRLARISLLFSKPFFGNIATTLKLKEASKWCQTFATDGRYLYYNTEFVKKLSKNELIFVIAHEILHCCLDHFGRRSNRDPGLWNMANDYVVNYILVAENIGKMPERVEMADDKSPTGISQRVGLYDPKYVDWTSEEVYDDLIKNSVEVVVGLDDHLDLGDDAKPGGSKGSGKGQTIKVRVLGDGDGPPDLSEEDLKKIRDELKNSMIRAAQSQDAGTIPAAIRRMIADLTDPVMDWRQLLELHIQSTIKNDYTFQRPSRKSGTTNTPSVLPGLKNDETVDVDIAIDTSGSISEDMLRDFLGEVKGIMDSYADYKIRLWSFDTKVYKYEQYTPDNGDELVDYPLKGGGGTDFMCNWRFMEDEEIHPKKFIMFTDGYPHGDWGIEDYCDTLFIIHRNTTIEAPFGVTAYYEPPE